MAKEHTDDTAFLDALRWAAGRCAVCPPGRQGLQQVTEVDHVEQGTASGYPITYCRTDLGYRLALARAQAKMDGVEDYQPTLPAVATPGGAQQGGARS